MKTNSKIIEKVMDHIALDQYFGYLTGYILVDSVRPMTQQEAKDCLYTNAGSDNSRIAQLDEYFGQKS